jgi:hypothetical protein
MSKHICILLLFSLFISITPIRSQQPAIPDSPVGRTFKAWLDAFNSGDRAVEEKYLHSYDPGKSLDDERRSHPEMRRR